MSLQGSLDTFALPDVLVLLSSTKKTGELRVAGGTTDGRVWVDKGQIVQSRMNGKDVAAVDTVFELLRLEEGTFRFDQDSTPDKAGDAESVDLVLADAQARMGEWQEIVKVVPHLNSLVDMAPEAPEDEVLVSAEQWKLLVAVAGGRTVSELGERMKLGEFDASKKVKQLVEAKLVTVDPDAKPKPKVEAKPAAKLDEAKTEDKPAAKAEAEAKDDDTSDKADKTDKVEAKDLPIKPKVEPEEPKPGSVAAMKARDEERGDKTTADDLVNRPKVRASTSGQGANGKDDKDEKAPATVGAKPARPGKDDSEEAKALVAQLAALGIDENDEEAVEKVADHLAKAGELPERDGDDSINRGLLLKFLSSVRN